MPKRKFNESNMYGELVNLPPKRSEIEYNTWVSATDVKNYLMNDPILDWFDRYYCTQGLNGEYNTRATQKKRQDNMVTEKSKMNVLFEKGILFEEKVLNHLRSQYQTETIAVNGKKDMNRKNYNKTVDAMMRGVPMIFQAVLYNDQNHTQGIADIMIRSDYINLIVNRRVLTDDEINIKAPNLSGNYHYCVIDIKWTSMTICADGIHIRNENRFPAYKGQMVIYNTCVGNIQGYTPTKAYIMSKHWNIDTKRNPQEGYNCFDILGTIDYSDRDNAYVTRTKSAIEWVRRVRREGSAWDPLNPTIEEMYPNSSNTNDAPWSKVKATVCNSIDEITKLWYVSVPHRVNAHSRGIMKWSDPRCTSQTLEYPQGQRANIIDMILNVNRGDDLIFPNKIQNNMDEWKQTSSLDFTVDFEYVNMCLTGSEMNIHNSSTESRVINMIGVGYTENNEWRYKCFTIEALTLDEEKRIIDEFTQFIITKSNELRTHASQIPKLFHWYSAETTTFNIVNKRHNYRWTQWEQNIRWVDMYVVFTSEPIVIKGSLCFKLKEIGKAMYNNGMISTFWDDSGVTDGLIAMIDSINYYKDKAQGIDDKKVIESVIKYNEIDCKVIWDILKYLREHHV